MPLTSYAVSWALFVALLVPGAASSSSFDVLTFDSVLPEISTAGNTLVARDKDGAHVRLTLAGRTLAAIPHTPEGTAARPDDILPDGVVVAGNRDIRQAWLGGPTHRYDHAVLGDDVEASRLVVIDRNGQRHEHELPERYVFEDRYPRLADIDDDGTDEIILIRSDIHKGAGIVVFGLKRGELTEVAASAPVGLRHRWMNVIGASDFNGDGSKEVAVVVTPHIGGTLTLLSGGGRLEPVFEHSGFSNHAYGPRELGMSAVLDLDRDGTPDIAVPDSGRHALVLLSLKGSRYRELHRVAHSSEISSGIHAVDLNGDGMRELAYLLADGSLVVVSSPSPTGEG